MLLSSQHILQLRWYLFFIDELHSTTFLTKINVHESPNEACALDEQTVNPCKSVWKAIYGTVGIFFLIQFRSMNETTYLPNLQ